MANYKRGKCRFLGGCRRNSESFHRKRLGLKPVVLPESPGWRSPGYDEWRQLIRRSWPDGTGMMRNTPRKWNIVYHTRPRRAREKRMEQAILRGTVDPDNAIFPLEKKPHIYYW